MTKVKYLELNEFVFICIGVALIMLGGATALVWAHHHGQHLQRTIQHCHSLGPDYHYWQDRSQCVKYVRVG